MGVILFFTRGVISYLSPVCFCMWIWRAFFWLKLRLHRLQLNGFSPVCILLWRISIEGLANTLLQYSQIFSGSARLASNCLISLLDSINFGWGASGNFISWAVIKWLYLSSSTMNTASHRWHIKGAEFCIVLVDCWFGGGSSITFSAGANVVNCKLMLWPAL